MIGNSTISLENLFQYLITLTVKNWGFFVPVTFPVWFLLLLLFVPNAQSCQWQEATGFYQEVSGSLVIIPFHQGFIYFPSSLFFSRPSSPSCLSLSSHERCSSTLRRGEGERCHLNISGRRAECWFCLFVLKD